MAVKVKAVHVVNIEKYVPAYKDRAFSWLKIYCRDAYDKKTDTHYRSFFDDDEITHLDELNRYRFISLVAREVTLGGPVPLDERNLKIMGWDLEKCSKSRTLAVLQKLVVSVTETGGFCNRKGSFLLHGNEIVCDTAKAKAKAKDKAKAKAKADEANDAPSDASLSLSRSERIAASLRQHLKPANSSDEIALNGVALGVDREIQDGRRSTTFEQQVRDRAYQASQRGDKPIALFFKMLHDDLGYPKD